MSCFDDDASLAPKGLPCCNSLSTYTLDSYYMRVAALADSSYRPRGDSSDDDESTPTSVNTTRRPSALFVDDGVKREGLTADALRRRQGIEQKRGVVLHEESWAMLERVGSACVARSSGGWPV